jgi:hypothetical protein
VHAGPGQCRRVRRRRRPHPPDHGGERLPSELGRSDLRLRHARRRPLSVNLSASEDAMHLAATVDAAAMCCCYTSPRTTCNVFKKVLGSFTTLGGLSQLWGGVDLGLGLGSRLLPLAFASRLTSISRFERYKVVTHLWRCELNRVPSLAIFNLTSRPSS